MLYNGTYFLITFRFYDHPEGERPAVQASEDTRCPVEALLR